MIDSHLTESHISESGQTSYKLFPVAELPRSDSRPFEQDRPVSANWAQRHMRSLLILVAVAFSAVMLSVCGYLGWSMISGQQAKLRIASHQQDLVRDRGRARLQQAEYNEVSEMLPELRERVAALEAQAQALQDENDALDAERTEAKGGYPTMKRATEALISETGTAAADLAEAQAEYAALLSALGLEDREVADP